MKHVPALVVMLTYNDMTVPNAYDVFHACRHSAATYWGFKEKGIPPDEMRRLFAYMHDEGKTTALEVVAYTEEEGLHGARTAAECGCDMLMGTMYFDSINSFCKERGIRYCPFVGEVRDRPSVLEGTAESMIEQSKRYLEKGVYGIDLLGYRYTGDGAALNRQVVKAVSGPVCVAGSVDSYRRLSELKELDPWGFTIGSAFFDHRFGDDIAAQIDAVCAYMERP